MAWYVSTALTLKTTGEVTARVRVWNEEARDAFRGSSLVYFLDWEDKEIWRSPIASLWVACTRSCKGESDRSTFWRRSLPKQLLPNISKYAIYQLEQDQPTDVVWPEAKDEPGVLLSPVYPVYH